MGGEDYHDSCRRLTDNKLLVLYGKPLNADSYGQTR